MSHSTSSSRMADLMLPVVTAIAIVAAFVVNILSNIVPEQNVGDIANTVFQDVLVLPASYAFSIWGLIYLGLFAYGVYQFLPSQRQNPNTRQINSFLIGACLAQMIWIVLFTQQIYGWSLIAMLAILAALIGIYGVIQRRDRPGARAERWCVQVPLRIYLSWISVATIVNGAVVLYSQGWTGGAIAPALWSVLMMVVAAALALILLVQHGDAAFALVIAWALGAIAARHADVTLVWVTAAVLAIALLLLSVALPRFRV